MPRNSGRTAQGMHRRTDRVSGRRAAAAERTAGAVAATDDHSCGSEGGRERRCSDVVLEKRVASQEEERVIEEERAAEPRRDLADMQKREEEGKMREDGYQTTRSREAHEALNCHMGVGECGQNAPTLLHVFTLSTVHVCIRP